MIGSLISMVSSAIARIKVGAGKWHRWYVYPPVALLSAYFAVGLTWCIIPFTVLPTLAMGMGYTKWENEEYMGFRYGIVPSVLTAVHCYVAGVSPLLIAWSVASIGVGLMYWVWVNKSPRLAEGIAGAVLIGGMSLNGIL